MTPSLALEDLIAPAAAAALAMARPLGITLVIPVFTRVNLGLPLQAGFALAVGLPGVQPLLDALRAVPDGTLQAGVLQAGAMRLGLLAGKEVFAGILLGLFFGLPIWALQSAGEVLDTQRSAPAAGGNDPGAGGQVSATAALVGLSATVLFVAAGGLKSVAGAVYGSYALWPLLQLSPVLAPDATGVMLDMVDQLARTALLTAAPIMLAMLLADAAVMLVGRAVPRLGLFDLAATLRNLVFVAGLAFYAVYLVEFMGVQIGMLHDVAAQLRRVVP